MCPPVVGAALIAGAAGLASAGLAAQQAKKGRKAAAQQNAANLASAEKDRQRGEEQYNKANQRMPDVASLFASNQASARRGIGSTFLTGPAGAAANKLALGSPSLLGS